jgi:hypothetical protein
MVTAFHSQVPGHADNACLGRAVRQRAEVLEAYEGCQGGSIHNYAAASLQIRPRSARGIEHQVHFLPAIAIPLLVRDVFEPVEVRHGGIVEEHVDPAKGVRRKINQRLTVDRLTQIAWLRRNHRSAGGANRLDGRFRVADAQTAADHQSAFASEGESGFAANAAVGASDNANFPRKPVWHGSYASVECAEALRHCRSDAQPCSLLAASAMRRPW